MSITAPFIHRYAAIPCNSTGRDEITSEDPLPAIVEATVDGFVCDRATRLTEVKQETTDDR
jgi:hypothetical protein